MVNWSELDYDMLVNIASHINLIEDYLNFAAVCKPWRRAATKHNFNSDLPRVPWLMLAEGEEDIPHDGKASDDASSPWRKNFSLVFNKMMMITNADDDDGDSCRKFVSLYNGMVLKKRVPNARGKKCVESLGWLVTTGNDDEVRLLHPFSGVQIELPYLNDYDPQMSFHPWTLIFKAVLSASPSQTSDYVVMVSEGVNGIIYHPTDYLSFWRPGDLKWTRIGRENYLGKENFRRGDVVYFDGKFYAVDGEGWLLVCDVTSADPCLNTLVEITSTL